MATSTNQIDFTLNANTKDFEANINNSIKAVENLSNNNDTLSESLEDVSKFMKEAAKINTDLTKAIKDLAKAFDDSVDSTNKEAKALDNVSKDYLNGKKWTFINYLEAENNVHSIMEKTIFRIKKLSIDDRMHLDDVEGFFKEQKEQINK